MKTKSLIKPAIIIVGCFAFAGCQKEAVSPIEANLAQATSANKAVTPQQHQLKGETTAGYYFFIPDIAAGYVAPNPAPGWYPGVAIDAHLNLLGKSQGFVNMHATFGEGGLECTAAPLNMFFVDQLAEMGITIPDAVGLIYFDKQGNSIWGRATGTFTVTPASPTRAMFSGCSAEILGGTGKFANATGSFVFSGYFNPQDTNDVSFVIDGTIVY